MEVNRQRVGAVVQPARAVDSAFAQRIVALLVGLAAGWLMVAIANQIGGTFQCASPSNGAIMSACLLAVALGVRAPRKVALALARLFRRPGQYGRIDTPSGMPGSDRQLLWTILAASAMLAGLGIALIPVTVRVGAWVYSAAIEHFFWLDGTHAVLVAVLSVLVVAVPLLLVGVVLVCLNQLAGLTSRSGDGALSWLIAAAAVGSVLCSHCLNNAPRPELLVLFAALPFFAVAIFAASRCGACPQLGMDDARVSQTISIPQAAGSLEFIVLITTVAVAGMVVLWAWLLAMRLGGAGSYCVLCAAALGFGGDPVRGAGRAPGVAMPIAFAGLFGIVAAIITVPGAAATGVGTVWAIGVLAVFAAARALRRARHRVLERTLSPNATATRLLFECLWWPGVALLAMAIFAPDPRACHRCLIALGLAIAAAGAVAILDLGAGSLRRRIAGAALVLAVAIGLTLWMPSMLLT